MNKMQSFFGVWTVIFILQKHRLPNFNPGEANNYNIYQSSQSTYHTKLHLHSVASRYMLLDKARIFFFFFSFSWNWDLGVDILLSPFFAVSLQLFSWAGQEATMLLNILKHLSSLVVQLLIIFASVLPNHLWSSFLLLMFYFSFWITADVCWLKPHSSCLLNKLQIYQKVHWTSEENFTSSRFSRWWRDKMLRKPNLLFVWSRRVIFLWVFIPVHATLQMKHTVSTVWKKASWILSWPWVTWEYKMHWFWLKLILP